MSFRAAKRNLLVTLVGRGTSIGLNFLAVVWVIEYLGPLRYGPFVMVLSVVTLLDLAGEMSLFQIAVREIAKSRAKTEEWFGATTTLRVAIGAVGAAALLLAPFVLGLTQESRTLVHAGAALFLINSLKTPIIYFRARLMGHWELGPWILARAVELGLVVLIIRADGSATQLMIAKAATAGLHVTIMWALLLGIYRITLRTGRSLWKPLIRYSIPVGAIALLMLVQLKGDILLIGSFLDKAAVGAFGAIAQIPEFLLVATSVLTISLSPVFAQCVGQRDTRRFQSVYQRVFDLLIHVLPPLCIVGTLFAHPILEAVFGAEYLGVVTEFQVVIWVGGMIPIAALVGCAAVALNLQKRLVKVEVTNVVIYVVANLLLLALLKDTVVSAWIRLLVVLIGPARTYGIICKHSPYRLSFRSVPSIAVASVLSLGIAAWLASYSPAVACLSVAASYTVTVGAWRRFITGRWSAETESDRCPPPELRASRYRDTENRSPAE